jgi:putative ABC transport system substrate-binding protein
MRWAKRDDREAIQRFAKELVALQPDLVLSTTTPTTAALLQQTRVIPIVFVNIADPVGSGFVASFPRPGGNATGFITMEPTMATTWVELLKEIVPSVKRVALLFNPATATYADYYINRSTPPLRPWRRRRSQPVFTLPRRLNPSLPHRHARRMAA